jgi:MoaA/NifB/PqqE/SkfB family radical SAM enzyme
MRKITQRGEIRMGFRCNARCGFCYYQDALDTPEEEEPDKAKIIRQLGKLREAGATEIEFTGGEPTIKAHLAECIIEAKAMGFANISIISNGLRLAKQEYCQRLVDAGLNDALLSIHGADALMHDSHTGIAGSFNAILNAAENLRSTGVRLRASLTLTARNAPQLPEILALFRHLQVGTIHIAVFSPVAAASATEEQLRIDYHDAGRAITSALDHAPGPLPPISIKYIPFCFVPGYEQLVMNLYQQSYDPDDWHYFWSNRVRRANNFLTATLMDLAALSGFLILRCRKTVAADGLNAMKAMGFTRLIELIRKHHPKACRQCRFYSVCDGVWRGYQSKTEGESVTPIQGVALQHPAEIYTMAVTREAGVTLPLQQIPVKDISGL